MNMKKMSDVEQKEKSLEILNYIDQICRANKIEYSIGYGTLLGAVRHGGFIPWDDDIDIVLLRPEYDKLISILKNSERYDLFSFETKDEWRYYFAKLCDSSTRLKSFEVFGDDENLGVFVDIFPLENLPDNSDELMSFSLTALDLEKKMELVMANTYARSTKRINAYIKKLIKYPIHVITKKAGNYQYRKELFNNFIQSNNVTLTKNVGLFNEIDHTFNRKIFNDYEDIKFESLLVRSVKKKHEFLISAYGDYMMLPPKNERVTHHPYTAWKIVQ